MKGTGQAMLAAALVLIALVVLAFAVAPYGPTQAPRPPATMASGSR